MVTNKKHDNEELLELSQLAQNQKTEKNSQQKYLNERQEELISDIEKSLRNIANLSDKEIKKLYDELKVNFYLEPAERRLGHKYNDTFNAYKDAFKYMIKSYKKRSNFRYLKKCKYVSAVAAIYSALYLFRNDDALASVPMWPFSDGYLVAEMGYREGAGTLMTNMSAVEYYQHLVSTNLESLIQSPQAEIVGGAFALGLALYAAGKGFMKYDDIKTMRRLMVQAMGENMSINEIYALKNKFSDKENLGTIEETSVASVKEAMNTYPLKDFTQSNVASKEDKSEKIREKQENKQDEIER